MAGERAGRRSERRQLLLVLAGAAAIRLALIVATPAWQSPDEYPHYWVAQEIARTGRLPDSAPVFPRYESFQPPLYYAAASIIVRWVPSTVPFTEEHRPPDAGLLLLRLLSAAAGLLTILAAAKMLREVPELSGRERTGALLFLAFLPSYAGVSASVNNDVFAVLFAALSLRYAMKREWTLRTMLLCGLWAGVAALSKLSALIIVPVLLLRVWEVSGRNAARALHNGLIVLGMLAGGLVLLAVRNLVQYGGLAAINPGIVTAPGLSPLRLIHAMRNLAWSFWLAFGRTYQISLHPAVYLVTALPLMVLAAAGWVRLWRLRQREFLTAALTGIAVAGAASLAYTLAYPYGVMTSWGKNLFPCLPLIAPAMVIGWNRCVPGRVARIVPALALALLCAGCLWGIAMLA